ncbi:polyprenyl synthetase family protein [Georgenia sp. Z1491]|uniref:polyprenyl synthetase family protein n=1 Tax=Georgenia sp. Z1491 TaxID=3416707 RepID=UPI003CF6BBB4
MTRLELLSARLDQVDPALTEVEERLAAAVRGADRLTEEPAAHLSDAGGKRLRPLLTIVTAQLGSGVGDEVVRAAVAVELTHLATLYHDDIMDSAEVRRGVPAAHVVWGNNVAVLTGDLLFARASSLVASLGAEAVMLHAATFERLCLGQLHETVGPDEGSDEIEHYLRVLADKTGSLIAASAFYGARFSGAEAHLADAVSTFGEKVGVAFQLADDVIDVASDTAESGKVPGTDLREGVATMPVLLLRARRAAGTLDPAGERALALLDGDLSGDAELAAAVEALRAHEVMAESRAIARRWADDAVAELAVLPDGEVKDALTDLATMLVDRIS